MSDPQLLMCDHAAHDIKDTGPLFFRYNPFYSDLGYSLDNLGFNSQHERDFSFLQNVQTGSRTQVKNEQSYTSALPLCLHGMQSDN